MLKDTRRRPLPATLRARLSSIPRRVVVCRDHERLYAAAVATARGRGAEPAAAEHLASCQPCRTLYGTLTVAFAERPPAPPATLIGRLKGIARGVEPLPAWVTDGRWATAACLLLAVVLTAMAGDSAALFRDASSNLETRATAWSEAGESRGRQLWDGFSSHLTASYESGRQQIEDFTASCETLYHRAVRSVGSLVHPDREPATEGDNDGKSEPESP